MFNVKIQVGKDLFFALFWGLLSYLCFYFRGYPFLGRDAVHAESLPAYILIASIVFGLFSLYCLVHLYSAVTFWISEARRLSPDKVRKRGNKLISILVLFVGVGLCVVWYFDLDMFIVFDKAWVLLKVWWKQVLAGLLFVVIVALVATMPSAPLHSPAVRLNLVGGQHSCNTFSADCGGAKPRNQQRRVPTSEIILANELDSTLLPGSSKKARKEVGESTLPVHSHSREHLAATEQHLEFYPPEDIDSTDVSHRVPQFNDGPGGGSDVLVGERLDTIETAAHPTGKLVEAQTAEFQAKTGSTTDELRKLHNQIRNISPEQRDDGGVMSFKKFFGRLALSALLFGAIVFGVSVLQGSYLSLVSFYVTVFKSYLIWYAVALLAASVAVGATWKWWTHGSVVIFGTWFHIVLIGMALLLPYLGYIQNIEWTVYAKRHDQGMKAIFLVIAIVSILYFVKKLIEVKSQSFPSSFFEQYGWKLAIVLATCSSSFFGWYLHIDHAQTRFFNKIMRQEFHAIMDKSCFQSVSKYVRCAKAIRADAQYYARDSENIKVRPNGSIRRTPLKKDPPDTKMMPTPHEPVAKRNAKQRKRVKRRIRKKRRVRKRRRYARRARRRRRWRRRRRRRFRRRRRRRRRLRRRRFRRRKTKKRKKIINDRFTF